MLRRFSPIAFLLSVIGSFCVSTTIRAELTGTLTVAVEGLQSQEGNVCLKLFSGSQGFPNDNESAVERVCVAIASPTTDSSDPPESVNASESSDASEATDSTDSPNSFTYTFENLPYGTYAIAIYHDTNGDEQLDRGAFGMPTEAYGFSNDAPAITSPPRYEDAIFLLAGSDTTIQIRLQYPQ
ncbi:MAG: DUF2141 domain-containing protein [Cyanobacteria bacterium CRU_2_1]|nr:DUF2141 domain-containing protein [Cyanobacteria bacterium RU_5_0]NJR59136.1 DUF2141 domain-containing protein [Cyanobacteria bacterium CRU_2_1]